MMVGVARKFVEPPEDDEMAAVQQLCKRLARESGERVGTVDVVLWFAASKGIIPGISLRRQRLACHADNIQ